MKKWLDMADDDNPVSIVNMVYDECLALREFSGYEREIMKVFRNRVYSGGMVSDKWSSVAGMILLANRPVDEGNVEEVVNNSVGRYLKKFGRKPVNKDLEWFNFDMHTAAGKLALHVFMKQISKNKEY